MKVIFLDEDSNRLKEINNHNDIVIPCLLDYVQLNDKDCIVTQRNFVYEDNEILIFTQFYIDFLKEHPDLPNFMHD